MEHSKKCQAIYIRILTSFRSFVKDEDGQALIEFLFLFLIMVSLSFLMVKNVGVNIGNRWVALLKVITNPTDSVIE
ncbi:TadE/TadG family type IV pilus assembly protein [Bacteriovorax sp. Seq25_V]|uniref:TadE/TadG family type IV pilus assembly protein n=1 Tax=Bacteriovorax sp. Seq25_V TaxID=1201288 RepID=UPI00038A313E|nr:hypothetical protein [Bacteriovorax sp. Seq25_V]EQC43545.1 hypothetical protein M900_2809 [Bacteriovorax sp. Seq25_V]